MSKQQVVEAIRQRNPSAEAEFLTSFSQQTLECYLKRLTDVCGHRGAGSIWVRTGDIPAVVMR